MVKLIDATSPTLRLVIGAFLLGAVFVGAGIWLVYLHAAGETTYDFHGYTISTGNVGIAAMVIGAFATVVLLRRSLSTLDRLADRDFPLSDLVRPEQSARVEAWPKVKNERTLCVAVKALSEKQWAILEAIEAIDGRTIHSMEDELRHVISQQNSSIASNHWMMMALLSWTCTAPIYRMICVAC